MVPGETSEVVAGVVRCSPALCVVISFAGGSPTYFTPITRSRLVQGFICSGILAVDDVFHMSPSYILSSHVPAALTRVLSCCQVIAREIFNPNMALFVAVPEGSSTFQPNPNSVVQSIGADANHLDLFKFAGRVVAKALFDGQLIDAYFTRSFYKHMLGMPVRMRVRLGLQCSSRWWVMTRSMHTPSAACLLVYGRWCFVVEPCTQLHCRSLQWCGDNAIQTLHAACSMHPCLAQTVLDQPISAPLLTPFRLRFFSTPSTLCTLCSSPT